MPRLIIWNEGSTRLGPTGQPYLLNLRTRSVWFEKCGGHFLSPPYSSQATNNCKYIYMIGLALYSCFRCVSKISMLSKKSKISEPSFEKKKSLKLPAL